MLKLDAAPGVIGGLVYDGVSSSLYQIALHEIGHSLGLAHSDDTNAVMYPFAEGTQNQTPNASDIAGILTEYAAVACYAEGTRILAARGEIAVEALRVGEMVPGLRSRRLRRVRWIGQRMIVADRHPRPHDVRPIRVVAGAFGPGLPHRDLRLSPDHAVLVEGGLVPVRYLVNGASIRQEPVSEVTYFHVELEDPAGEAVHDVMAAEGLPAESYLDTGNRGDFAEAGAVLRLHPEFSRGVWAARGCADLHVCGEVVARARRSLLRRAVGLGYGSSTDPQLQLCNDGRIVEPFAMGAGRWRFRSAAGAVRLLSRTAVPAEVREADGDGRRLGVAIARIALDGKVIPLDDPRLEAGFFAMETAGSRRWRWTDGDALLRLEHSGMLDITLVFSLAVLGRGGGGSAVVRAGVSVATPLPALSREGRGRRQMVSFVVLTERGVFRQGFHVRDLFHALLLQKVGNSAAQAGVGDPVRGIGGLRQVAALDLVFALGSGLDPREAVGDGEVDGAGSSRVRSAGKASRRRSPSCGRRGRRCPSGSGRRRPACRRAAPASAPRRRRGVRRAG